MNHRTAIRISLVFLLVIFISACTTGKQQYDVAMQLSQAGKDREALAYLEQALANEPNNKTYQQALVDLKEKLVSRYIEQGTKILAAATPMTLAAMSDAKAQVSEAQAVDPTNPKIGAFQDKLKAADDAFQAEIKALYSDAKQAVEQEE